MDKNDRKLREQVLEECSFEDLREALIDCARRMINQINSDNVSKLCAQIKKLLKEQKREQLILRTADINDYDNFWDDDDNDEEEYEDDIDGDTYCEYEIDTNTTLASFACGGYSRLLKMNGVILDNNDLKFYLVVTDSSYKGDYDRNKYIEDLNGLMNDRCWWWDCNMPEMVFDPERVLKYYIQLLTDEEFLENVNN